MGVAKQNETFLVFSVQGILEGSAGLVEGHSVNREVPAGLPRLPLEQQSHQISTPLHFSCRTSGLTGARRLFPYKRYRIPFRLQAIRCPEGVGFHGPPPVGPAAKEFHSHTKELNQLISQRCPVPSCAQLHPDTLTTPQPPPSLSQAHRIQWHTTRTFTLIGAPYRSGLLEQWIDTTPIKRGAVSILIG